VAGKRVAGKSTLNTTWKKAKKKLVILKRFCTLRREPEILNNVDADNSIESRH
jgi:hypothetical protein